MSLILAIQYVIDTRTTYSQHPELTVLEQFHHVALQQALHCGCRSQGQACPDSSKYRLDLKLSAVVDVFVILS
jgi:hypothetical protein